MSDVHCYGEAISYRGTIMLATRADAPTKLWQCEHVHTGDTAYLDATTCAETHLQEMLNPSKVVTP